MCDEDGGPDRMGVSVQERIDGSIKGDLCGMRNCKVPPEQLCRACGLWYCIGDFEGHFAGYPEHRTGRSARQ